MLTIPKEAVLPDLSSKNTPSWDSVSGFLLISEIEKAFKLKFEDDEVMAVRSFTDAINLLTSKVVDLNE